MRRAFIVTWILSLLLAGCAPGLEPENRYVNRSRALEIINSDPCIYRRIEIQRKNVAAADRPGPGAGNGRNNAGYIQGN